MRESLPGHELAFGGSAVDDEALPTGQRGGEAACGCGERSEPLPGNGARRAWHRRHLAELDAEPNVELSVDDPGDDPGDGVGTGGRTGRCAACARLVSLTPAGIVRPHRDDDGRCRGSHKRPAT